MLGSDLVCLCEKEQSDVRKQLFEQPSRAGTRAGYVDEGETRKTAHTRLFEVDFFSL